MSGAAWPSSWQGQRTAPSLPPRPGPRRGVRGASLPAAAGAARARRRDTRATAGSRPEDEAEHLSLHFFHAHDSTKALALLARCRRACHAIYANVEAAAFFERALAAARHRRDITTGERATVLEGLGDVRVKLGDFEKASVAYRASLSRLGPNPLEATRVIMKQAQIPSWLGNYPPALRWITRGLGVLEGVEGTEAASERARLYAMYAAFRSRQGRLQDAIRWCLLAVEEAQAADARDALAHAYFLLDWAYASLGRYEEAVYSPLALSIYEELGNLHLQAVVLNNMGVFAHFQGRWDEALDLYRRAGQPWDKMGDRWHVAVTTVNVGEVLSDQGLLDEAEPLLLDALRVARALQSGGLLAEVTLRLGRLLSRAGRFEEAHAVLAEARDQNEYELEADARIAECFVLESEPKAALKLSKDALQRARSLDARFDVIAMLQRTEGCAYLQLGQLEKARTALELALEEAEAAASTTRRRSCSTRSLRSRGRPESHRGSSPRARRDSRAPRRGRDPRDPTGRTCCEDRIAPRPPDALSRGREVSRTTSVVDAYPVPGVRSAEDDHEIAASGLVLRENHRRLYVCVRALLCAARGVGDVGPEVLHPVVLRTAALRRPRVTLLFTQAGSSPAEPTKGDNGEVHRPEAHVVLRGSLGRVDERRLRDLGGDCPRTGRLVLVDRLEDRARPDLHRRATAEVEVSLETPVDGNGGLAGEVADVGVGRRARPVIAARVKAPCAQFVIRSATLNLSLFALGFPSAESV